MIWYKMTEPIGVRAPIGSYHLDFRRVTMVNVIIACVKCGSTEKTKSGKCRPCNIILQKKWRDNNKNYVKEYAERMKNVPCTHCGVVNRNSKGECRPCRNVTIRKYNEVPSVKEKKAESDRRWRSENTERKSATDKKWRDNNKERKRKTARAWEIRNADEIREKKQKYFQETKEISRPFRRVNASNRRAKKKSNGGTIPTYTLSMLLMLYGNLCNVCGDVMGKIEIDHVVPIDKGGKHELTNLQLLCPDCNRRKSNKLINKFANDILTGDQQKILKRVIKNGRLARIQAIAMAA